jgi:hypothetical protein
MLLEEGSLEETNTVFLNPDGQPKSVATFFSKRPTELELAIFKARAFDFASKNDFHIESFRVLETILEFEDVDLEVIEDESETVILDFNALLNAQLISAGFELVVDVAEAVGTGLVEAAEAAGEAISGIAEGVGELFGSIFDD